MTATRVDLLDARYFGRTALDRVRATWRLALWSLVPESLVGTRGDEAATLLPEPQTAAWLATLRTLHAAQAADEAEAGQAEAARVLAALTSARDAEPTRLDLAAELLQLGPEARALAELVLVTALDPALGHAARTLAQRLGRTAATEAGLLDDVLALAGYGPGVARQLADKEGALLRDGVLVRDGQVLLAGPALLAFLRPELAPRSPLADSEAESALPEPTQQLFAQLRTGWLAVLERALLNDRPILVSGGHGFGGAVLVQALGRARGIATEVLQSGALFAADTLIATPHLPHWTARARLSPAVWALTGVERWHTGFRERPTAVTETLHALRRVARPIVLIHEGPVPPEFAARLAVEAGIVHVEVPALTPQERASLLQSALQVAGVAETVAAQLGTEASHFSLGAEQVASAVAHALQMANTRVARAMAKGIDAEEPEVASGELAPTTAEMRSASTTAMTSRLRQYGSRVDTTATWDDLVLAEEPLAQVKTLARFARVREKLFGEYGFGEKQAHGRALSAMFSGPSGTGKTMAAGLVARELGVELYRVDLSRVVSKYIGETEERIGSLFSEATQVGAALLFDEADSLFGQRTEIRSSNDRYANLEVNYLLQRLETFDGVVILTTNFATSIDEAFLRRLRFRVQFPFPRPKDRATMWEVMIPPQMPVADDGLDFDWLGQTFDLSGGHIRNAVLRAAMIAADADKPMAMRMVYDAAAAEYRELGKLAPPYPFDDDD